MRADASNIEATSTNSAFVETPDSSNSTFGSGDGSFMRRNSSVVNDAVSAEWSLTSSTITSTAVFIGSLITGIGGNGGVVSDSSTLSSSNTDMR